ncbi:GGDEF domain-containing protein [Terriglobus tenax]|uniref:GGDEF domain-containing protein n=1 Tax=Terriglobus tenax TaxID=1111115 RepID=UPI0021E00036|nr:GGDEF domain-containing protein [Terriglobus tenax]
MEHLLQWFDNRTLLICQLLLELMMASAFLLLRRVNPGMRGVGRISLGFALGVLALFLVATRGAIPLFVSAVVGNGIGFFSYYLVSRGIQRFLNDRSRYGWVLEISCIAGLLVLFYYCVITPDLIPRSIASAWVIGMGRLIPAIVLWRAARQSHFLRFGSIVFGIFSLLSLQRFILLFLQESPQNFMQRNSVQTASILVGFLYIGITGMFLLAMITSEMRAATLRTAQIDSLTGALTRAAAEQKFAQELELAGRTGLPLSLLLIDIDNFKYFNDTAGHAAGDEALRHVAEVIQQQLRVYDTFGRFGGDEMLLLLPSTPGPDALIVAGRIRGALQQLPPEHGSLPVTVSVGIAQSEPHDTTRSLLARADSALYHVKRTGRNSAYFLPYGMTPPAQNASESAAGPHALAD